MSNKNSRTKNSALSLVTGVGGQLLNEALRFITRTVFIYTLGKMFLGINGLFAEIMTMLSLTNLGIGTAIIFRLYKPIAENDEHRVRILLKFYKKAYQSIGVFIFLLGLCLLPFLKVFIKDYDRFDVLGLNAEFIYLLYLGHSVTSYFFFAYRNCVFAADQKQYLVNGVNMISSIVTAVVQIIVLYLWQDFILYLLVGIFDNILKNVVIASLTYKQYPNYFKKENDSLPKDEVKSMFKDCGALFLYKINGVVQKSTGNLILSAFIGLATVGIYSNYLVIYSALRQLSNQLFNAIKGSTGNLFATATLEGKYKFFEIMNYLTALVFGTMGVVISININELIYCWLGEDYIIPQPFPVLLGIEILVLGLSLNLNQIRNVSGLYRQMWTRPILSILINLVSTLILVKQIEILAIPLGYIIAFTTTNFIADPAVIHKYVFNNEKSVWSYYARISRYLVVICLAGVFTYYLMIHIDYHNTWGALFLHVFMTCTIVAGLLILVNYKSESCRYLLSKIRLIK